MIHVSRKIIPQTFTCDKCYLKKFEVKKFSSGQLLCSDCWKERYPSSKKVDRKVIPNV